MSLYDCVFSVSRYKPRQGILVRRVFHLLGSLCAVGLGVSIARAFTQGNGHVVVGVFVSAMLWLSWRTMQYPPICDFLIDVQVESGRVSWPRVVDVKRFTLVVLFVMFLVSLYLFLCDRLLQFLLRAASVLKF